MRTSRLPALLCATLLAACASSGRARPAVATSSPDVVTAVEIAATPAQNAYDLVNRLRPRWLQQPRAASISGGRVRNQVIVVYLDGARLGGADALRSISASGIKSMRYYDAVRAAAVLRDPGTEPIAGAIVLTTGSEP